MHPEPASSPANLFRRLFQSGLFSRQAVLACWYMTLATLPLSGDAYFEAVHSGLLLPVEPLMALTCLLLTGHLLRPPDGKAVRLMVTDRLVIGHLGALGVAMLFSDRWFVSGKFYATLLLYAAVGYALPRLLRLGRAEWRNALLAWGGGTLILTLYVLVRHLLYGANYSVSYWIAQPLIEHGHTNLTVLLEPLLLGLALVQLRPSLLAWRIPPFLIWCATTVLVAVVTFSYSRASYVSLVSQALLLLAWGGWAACRRMLPLWGLAVAISMVTWIALDWRYGNQERNTSVGGELLSVTDFGARNESNAERASRWRVGLNMWLDNPLTGVGPGTFPDRYLEYVAAHPDHPVYYTTQRRMNIHNLYLGWLVESGVPAALTGLGLLAYVLVRLLLRFLRRRSLAVTALAAYYTMFILHSFVQDFWQEPRVIVGFWLVLAVQVPLLRHRHRPRPRPEPATT